MRRANRVLLFQIGYGSGDTETAVQPPCGQMHALCRSGQVAGFFFSKLADTVQACRGEPGIGATLAGLLKLSAACHASLDWRRRFCRCCARQQLTGWQARHGHMQVNAVQQGSRQPRSIALDLLGPATTGALRVTEKPARTWIHGGYQLKAGRIGHSAFGASQGDFTGFQGLAQ